MKVLFPLLLLLLSACTGPGAGHNDRPLADPSRMAMTLRTRGLHLQASYYLEAALLQGDNELHTLPLLIDSQVRAGRLLASLASLTRYCTLAPDDQSATSLYQTILQQTDTTGVRTKEACQ